MAMGDFNIRSTIAWDKGELDAKTRQAAIGWLGRVGAYVCRAAHNSIRNVSVFGDFYNKETRQEKEREGRRAAREKRWIMKHGREKTAPPGKPPYDHGRGYPRWRNSFMFAVDEARMSVVIGPIGKGYKKMAQLHEFGGSGLAWVQNEETGKWGIEKVTYPARPTMAPALQRSSKFLSRFWKDAIK